MVILIVADAWLLFLETQTRMEAKNINFLMKN
jgi:hypothetical protein